MNLSAKIFIESHECYILGPGRVELLRSVDSLGSLHKAAQKLGMSYRWAWGRLNDAEKALGFELLAKDGNTSGNTKTLTPKARELLQWYGKLESEIDEVLSHAMVTKPEFLNDIALVTLKKQNKKTLD